MTTLIAKPKLLTADDLLRLHSQGVRGELVRGVLIEKMPSGEERGELTATVGYLLSGIRQAASVGARDDGRRRHT